MFGKRNPFEKRAPIDPEKTILVQNAATGEVVGTASTTDEAAHKAQEVTEAWREAA